MNIQKLIEDLEHKANYLEYGGDRSTARLLKQAATALKEALVEPALKRYTETIAEAPIDSALERLRYFCSIAMKNGQDWLDVESFFADVEAEINAEAESEDRGVAGPNLEAYCLWCEKRGHFSRECWSTHGLNTPAAKELGRLCDIAQPPMPWANMTRPTAPLTWVNPAPHAEPPLVPSPSITVQLKYGETASIAEKPKKVLVSFTRDHPDHIWYKCTWPDGSHSECGDLDRIESRAEAQGIEIEWVGETE